MDRLPKIDGFIELFGMSVFQCPYCDGWEFKGQPLAAYGKRRRGMEMARALTAWSSDILLCTDGPSGFRAVDRKHLERNGIRLSEDSVARLEGDSGRLKGIVFRNGRFNRHGGVKCGKYEATSVPGVYVAGNIIKDVQLSIVAAAEGARAAFGINLALTPRRF